MANRLFRATCSSTVALALLPGAAHAFRVDYSIDFGVERNDNVLLTPTDEIETTILRPGFGFSLVQESSTVQAEFSGRGEFLDYRDDRFDDTLEGTLSGRLNWVIIQERLSFTFEDSLTVQPVNTLFADSPGNRQQVNVVSLGPTLLFNPGQSLHGAAELRFINSDAEVTEEFNSDRVNLAIRAIKDLTPTSDLSANLQVQRVDFEDDLIARDYDRTDFYGRYARRLASFDLAVDAGLSRIDYHEGGGDRSEPLYRVQAAWRPDDRHRLSLRATSQFSDTASDALTGIETGASATGEAPVVPGQIPIGDVVVNSSPFEVRGLDLEYALVTPRMTAVVAPYYSRLRYIDSDEFDQNTSGVLGEVTWRANPRLLLGATGGVGRVSYIELDREDRTSEFGVHADYRWSRRLSSRFSATRYRRDVSVAGEDADQTVLMFTLTYRNR